MYINTFEGNRSVIDNVRNNNDRVDNRPGLILIINHDYFYLIEIFFNQTLFCNVIVDFTIEINLIRILFKNACNRDWFYE